MKIGKNAVSKLRDERQAQSRRPFIARGSNVVRCDCRLPVGYCICPVVPRNLTTPSSVGFCLLMSVVEPFKPTNTGWLIADVVSNTTAFCWSRTEPSPALDAVLCDQQWQPYVVFPGDLVEPSRVIAKPFDSDKPPLFILIDATWPEARKIFRKSPYLASLPVLSLSPDQLSAYRLRRSKVAEHLCTSEVASLCLQLAGQETAARALDAYLDVFSSRYLAAKQHQPSDTASPAFSFLSSLRAVE